MLGVPPLARVVDEIVGQSKTYVGHNPEAVRVLWAARVDLATGSILLALGFGMQAAAIYGFSVSSVTATVVLLGLPAIGLLYFCWLRRYMSATLVARVKARLKNAN